MNDKQRIAELEQEIVTLRKKIDQVDDWANGIYMALQYTLCALLPECDVARKKLQKLLALEAKQYEQMERQGLTHTSEGMPLERFEASKILYRTLEVSDVWDASKKN